jgi:polysaccharide pyruvyl transferase CsaB
MTLRAFIAGYYGAGNAGDEWILNGLLAELRRRDPATDVRVLSYDPKATQRDHGVEAIGWGDVETLAAAVRWSSLVIVGGGGLWQDYWGFDPLSFLDGRPGGIGGYGTPILLAHLLGRPCALLGAGVGPLQAEASRNALRDLAAIVGAVSVRDSGSRQELVACGVEPDRIHLGADLAFLAQTLPSNAVRPSGRPTLAVNLRPWTFAGEPEHWEAEIVEALRAWCSTSDGKVLLTPLHESDNPLEDDRAIAERVVAAIGQPDHVQVTRTGLPWTERIAALAGADVVLGMRYHSLLAAIRAGVPCVALAYDPKVRYLMEDASAAGCVIELSEVSTMTLVDRLAAGSPSIEAEQIDGLCLRAEAAIEQAMQLERSHVASAPALVGEFVVAQSAYLGRLEETLRDRFWLPPASAAPRADVGLEAIQGVVNEVKRLERELDRARVETMQLKSDNARATEYARALEQDVKKTSSLLEAERSRASDSIGQLAALRTTLGVRLLDGYWRLMGRLAPEGSRARAAYRRVRLVLKQWRIDGRNTKVDPGLDATGAHWPAGRQTAARGDVAWFQALDDFLEAPFGQRDRGVVFVLAPTRYASDEGQRSFQIARELAARGWRVVFGYWRWNIDQDVLPSPPDACVLAIPLDVLLSDPERVLKLHPGQESWAVLEFPFPGCYRFLATANARGFLTIYDAVDDWMAFHKQGQAPWYDLGFERSLGTACDALLAVSPALAAIIAERCGRPVHVVPNGWAPDAISNSIPAPIGRGAVTLGYFGHLTESWFDWDLLIECARVRPEWRFHLIGYGGGWRTTRLPPNVAYHGKLPRASLASYAAGWDVGIVPFRDGAIASAADPIKVYEYLALDLPVVGSGIHPPAGAEGLVETACDRDSFLGAVESCVAARKGKAGQRRVFAAASTWAGRVDAMEGLILADEPRAAFKRRIFEGA